MGIIQSHFSHTERFRGTFSLDSIPQCSVGLNWDSSGTKKLFLSIQMHTYSTYIFLGTITYWIFNKIAGELSISF